MSDQWVRALDAWGRTGVSDQGASAIQYAADGLVRTRAALFDDGSSVTRTDEELPRAFWSMLRGLARTSKCDWSAGIFRSPAVARTFHEGPKPAQRALGVEFLAADLDRYFPALITSRDKPPAKEALSDDDLFVQLMKRRVDMGIFKSVRAASLAFGPLALGAGTDDSRAKRLERLYTASYPKD